MLRFSPANAKLVRTAKFLDISPKHLFSLDLLSGWSCPFAKTCQTKVVKRQEKNKRGKFTKKRSRLVDGENSFFRCFSAQQEVYYPHLYKLRKGNLDLIKSAPSIKALSNLIIESLPKNAEVIRLHVGGDFISQRHFDAIVRTARMNKSILWYGYTKSLPFWIARLNKIPDNLILTASYGGTHDKLIGKHKLRSAKVVFHPKHAKKMKLEIDHDDSLASKHGSSFALLLHGHLQKKGSEAKAALVKLKQENIEYAYQRK